MNLFGELVHNVRKQQNLSQQELAELAHCSTKTISNLENGKSINSNTLECIFIILNIHIK